MRACNISIYFRLALFSCRDTQTQMPEARTCLNFIDTCEPRKLRRVQHRSWRRDNEKKQTQSANAQSLSGRNMREGLGGNGLGGNRMEGKKPRLVGIGWHGLGYVVGSVLGRKKLAMLCSCASKLNQVVVQK